MGRGDVGRRSLLGSAIGGAGLLVAPDLAMAASSRPKVAIKTAYGTITVVLEDRRAPLTCANFLRYVDAQAYDNGVFFRAARDRDDPTHGQIVGRPEPNNHPFPPIAHESTTMTGLRHVAGTISLGRFEPGSATCNFFICASPEPYLDAHPGEPGDNLGYAAFGSVVSGLGVVRRILSLPTNGKTKYVEQRGQWLDPPVTITSMRRV